MSVTFIENVLMQTCNKRIQKKYPNCEFVTLCDCSSFQSDPGSFKKYRKTHAEKTSIVISISAKRFVCNI